MGNGNATLRPTDFPRPIHQVGPRDGSVIPASVPRPYGSPWSFLPLDRWIDRGIRQTVISINMLVFTIETLMFIDIKYIFRN